MTYEEALKFIHSKKRTSGAPTLERMRLLCRYLDDPQKKMRFVHIAGTNGKGSSAAMLSRVLECAGYRVGRYISPYIIEFCERMSVNGEMIEKDTLAALCGTVAKTVRRINHDIKKIRSGEKNSAKIPKRFIDSGEKFAPVEFEVVTAIAFLYFLSAGCDIVVLECGLGGEYDATNVIPAPKLALITSISFDHTELLGNTINKIAKTKCGIIKKGTGAVISYPQPYAAASKVIEKRCEKMRTEYIVPAVHTLEITDIRIGELKFKYKRKEYATSLCAKYQANNAILVIEAAHALSRDGFDISDEAIKTGLATAKFPARFEVLGARPAIILDGAHNEDGMRVLAESVSDVLPKGRLHLVIGMLSDKHPDIALASFKGALESLTKTPVEYAEIITLTPANPRALSSDKLADIVSEVFGGDVPVRAYKSAARGLAAAIKSAAKDDMLLCFGSLYMAAEIREKLPSVMLTV